MPSDSPSLRTLYVEHHGWLRVWLGRRLGNTADAADLAQDTFVRVLGRDDVSAIREPRALLVTIAKGLMANAARRRQVEMAYRAALASLPQAHAASAEAHAVILQTLHELDAALAGLPRAVRQAFLLSQWDGLPQGEIAQRLGLSVATVRRHIARAIAQCCLVLA